MESPIQQLLELLSPIQQFLKLPIDDNSSQHQAAVKALNTLKKDMNQQVKLLLHSATKLKGSVGFPDQCDNNTEDVALIQKKLNIRITGAYNDETEKAIHDYQLSIGFQKPDGVISPKGRTFSKMQEEQKVDIEFSEEEADVIYGYTPDTLKIEKSVGNKGVNNPADVKVIKRLLEFKTIDENYTDDVAEEIQDFQEEYDHLVNDGRVDVGGKTWQQLMEVYKNSTKPEPRQPIEPITIESRPIQPIPITSLPSREQLLALTNTTGLRIEKSVGKGGANQESDVMVVQHLLDIKQTGKAKGRTIRCIKRFQRREMNMRPPSGIIQPNDATWIKLNGGKSLVLVDSEEQDTSVPYKPDNDVIEGSVGADGDNKKWDVIKIKYFLSEKWDYTIAKNKETNDFDDTVDEAFKYVIRQFQYRYAGSIYSQDGRVDPGGTTWKYLTGKLKPVMGKTESGILGGVETPLEKQMAEFTRAFSGIVVTLKTGEQVTVRPPYHINLGGRMKNAVKARAANQNVTRVISSLGWGSSFGKASPSQIQTFLQTCIDKNYVPSNKLHAKGLYEFLALYGVSTDCSGLAIQAANFLLEGDLDRKNIKEESVGYTNTSGIQRHDDQHGTKTDPVTKPTKLRAGDMMVNYKREGTSTYHVRVVVDVDNEEDGIAFTTVESGSSMTLGADGHGVGQRRWKFPNKAKFEDLSILKGNKWEYAGKSDQAYTYVRLPELYALEDTPQDDPLGNDVT